MPRALSYTVRLRVSHACKQNFEYSAKTRPCITAGSGRGRRVIMLTSVIKLHHLLADVAFRFRMDTSFSRKFLIFRGGFVISGYKSKMYDQSVFCSVPSFSSCVSVCGDCRDSGDFCRIYVHKSKDMWNRNKISKD